MMTNSIKIPILKKESYILLYNFGNCFFHIGSADDMDIFGASVSDDDDDADPLPWESSKPLRPDDPILPDGSSKSKLSPLLAFHRGPHAGGGHPNRPEPPPVIIKQSLKNFSGLEGVSPLTLSTQDSLETSSGTKSGTSTSTSNVASSGIGTSISNTASASVSETKSSMGSSLEVASTNMTKRSIQAEKSAPLASTNYSKLNSNTITPGSQMASSSSSSTLFAKVGKSTKKHSLDEDILNTGITGKFYSILFYQMFRCTT